MEAELVKREGIPFETIPAAGVHGVGLRALPGNLWRLARGVLASRRILSRFRPQVLLFTGGYLAVPMAAAARLTRGVRCLLYVPDVEPGLALKVLARFADRIAVTTMESRAFLPRGAQLVETGYPLRPDLRLPERGKARRVLDLANDLPVVLVTGGSRGARSINQAVTASLPQLLPQAQIMHITGQLDWEESQASARRSVESLPAHLVRRYHAYPYLHEQMGMALAAADLVVSRAGASSLGEYPHFGLPAILVPYPYAWRYQQVNARFLEARGAALLLQDADLGSQLLPELSRLLADSQRLQVMRAAMRSLARPEAGEQIAGMLVSLAGQSGGAG